MGPKPFAERVDFDVSRVLPIARLFHAHAPRLSETTEEVERSSGDVAKNFTRTVERSRKPGLILDRDFATISLSSICVSPRFVIQWHSFRVGKLSLRLPPTSDAPTISADLEGILLAVNPMYLLVGHYVHCRAASALHLTAPTSRGIVGGPSNTDIKRGKLSKGKS